MPEWRNAYALVLETSSFGSESSNLSSGTKSNSPGCSWESSQTPNLAYSVRITAPAPNLEGEADGKPPQC